MKIRINKFWQNTQGVQVQAGDYEASDLPSGIAQYLVSNGHAVVIESASEPVNEGQADSEPSERDQLEAEYERLYDRKPSSNMKTETLVRRIAEALNDDTD